MENSTTTLLRVLTRLCLSLAPGAAGPSLPPGPHRAGPSSPQSVTRPTWYDANSRRSVATRPLGPFLALGHGALSLDAGKGCHHSARLAEITPVDALQAKHGKARRRSHQDLPGEIRGLQSRVKCSSRLAFSRDGQ